MHVLFNLKIVQFSAVSETVQSMLLSIELSGPALLSDASSSLMSTLVQERAKENPAHYHQSAERALNWLLSKWTPGIAFLPCISLPYGLKLIILYRCVVGKDILNSECTPLYTP